MNIHEAIITRRNIKKFTAEQVSRERIESWLQAASYAPNHRMTEPWEIVWIGPETRAKLAHKTDFGGAPVVLAVLCTPAKTQADRDEHQAAVSCFIQNFMLLAHSEGVGTGWSSLGIAQRVRDLLSPSAGHEIVGIIPVGYPEEVPAVKPRTKVEEKITNLP